MATSTIATTSSISVTPRAARGAGSGRIRRIAQPVTLEAYGESRRRIHIRVIRIAVGKSAELDFLKKRRSDRQRLLAHQGIHTCTREPVVEREDPGECDAEHDDKYHHLDQRHARLATARGHNRFPQ